MTSVGSTPRVAASAWEKSKLVSIALSEEARNAFTSEFIGTKTATQGSCSYTVNVGVAATLDSNNVLSGTLTYTPATNADASCGVLNSCSNTQTVAGTRTTP